MHCLGSSGDCVLFYSILLITNLPVNFNFKSMDVAKWHGCRENSVLENSDSRVSRSLRLSYSA